MEKIITVNIHNKEYKITEDAFRILEDYNNFIKRTVKEADKIYDIEIQISVIIDMETSEKGKDRFIDSAIMYEVIKVLRDNQTVLYQIPEKKQKFRENHERSSNYNETDMKRDTKNAIIGGVCAGIANKLKIDPLVIRILFIVLSLFFGVFILIYIILWIILPEDPNAVKRAVYTGKK
jgi:phage shock protein PspC (stress-responsive transcriptional regulator)